MGAIDADAHVIETVQTWSYLEGKEQRFTPQLMAQTHGEPLLSNEGIAVRDFWVIEGRAHGKDRNVGTDTSRESREMLSVARANLEKMIAALKKRRVAILLTGMRSLANWGEAYTRDFDAIFPDLAREHDLVYYPFFLDGVAMDAKLNLDDGLHPSGKGIAEIVNRIMPKVEELITRAAARREAATKS